MKHFRLASASWKWLITALAACAALLVIVDISYAIRPMLVERQHGDLGAELDDIFSRHPVPPGSHRMHVLALRPGSPLADAGAQVGDSLRFDRPLDRWRRFQVGERVGLTLYHGATPRHVLLTADAQPIGFADYADMWGRALLAGLALVFGLMVGFKQAESRAYRSLAKTFLALSMLYFLNFNYSPASSLLWVSKVAGMACLPLLWGWCVMFALDYQPYKVQGLRVWLLRGEPLVRAMSMLGAAYAAWWAAGFEAPGLGLAIIATSSLGILLTLGSTAEGWQQSSGEMRQRHMWLLVAVAAGAIPSPFVWMPALDWSVGGLRVTILASLVGQGLMYCGFAYAVLKLRVFNFDFAVNRAMVYSVVSVMLLCTVGLMEFLSKSLLKGDGNAHKSLLIDASIALAVYLIFHKLHHRIEQWVEKIFFFKWHDNEHRLRHFVRQAAHVTEVDALLSAFRSALDKFTGHAGCSIYLRQADGGYSLVGGTMPEAPELVDTNRALVVALRTDMAPAPIAPLDAAFPGELVLPMSHRGTLNGFAVVAAKANGESYRPDECEVLGFAAHQIGLDIHALRVEALEGEVRALEQKTEQQQLELQLMAGRRKSARALDLLEVKPGV